MNRFREYLVDKFPEAELHNRNIAGRYVLVPYEGKYYRVRIFDDNEVVYWCETTLAQERTVNQVWH